MAHQVDVQVGRRLRRRHRRHRAARVGRLGKQALLMRWSSAESERSESDKENAGLDAIGRVLADTVPYAPRAARLSLNGLLSANIRVLL